MRVLKSPVLCTSKPISKIKCLIVWCSDGWAYNFKTLKRQRYSLESSKILNIEEETFTKTVFSDAQYHEYIYISLISESPRQWIETSELFEEMFTEI